MSLSDWHRRDSLKAKGPVKRPGPPTCRTPRNSYNETHVQAFCEMIRQGVSVQRAVKESGIPISKAYDVLNRDRELYAIHEQNKKRGIQK